VPDILLLLWFLGQIDFFELFLHSDILNSLSPVPPAHSLSMFFADDILYGVLVINGRSVRSE
jgi:hypothetical protein